MAETLEKLKKDHKEFERVIAYLERDMDSCLRGVGIDLEVLKEFVDYCSTHADRFHHPLEDQLFTLLVAAHPQAKKSIEALEREHLEMRWATRDLQQMLHAINSDEYVRRDRFLEVLGEYLGLFYQHMKTEELEIFPLARKHLSEADWTVVDDFMRAQQRLGASDKQDFPRITRIS